MARINTKSKVYSPKIGRYIENSDYGTLKGRIYTHDHSIYPRKGDIYIRFNPENKGFFAAIFTGENKKFYAWQDEMGEETFGIETVDINLLLNTVAKLSIRTNNFSLEERINKALSIYPIEKPFSRT